MSVAIFSGYDMAFSCVSGGKECVGCGRCVAAPRCDSCQIAIGRGQEYYSGTSFVICTDCAEREDSPRDTECSLCGEWIGAGEEIIIIGSLIICGECADRCIR